MIGAKNERGKIVGKTVCIASGKGGTGKTALAAGLASAIAELGKTVLLVDLDIGLRNLDLVLGLTDSALFDFTDVLLERTTLEEAVTPHPNCEGLFFLAAPLGIPEEPITSDALKGFCETVKQTYDICILDCPAGIGEGFSQAASVADCAIVVCTPDQTSLRDAQMTRHALSERGVEDLRLVVNRVRGGVDGVSLDEAIDRTGIRLLGAVPEDKRVISCYNRGELILSKRTPAAKACRNMAQRLNGCEVPLLRTVR